ncbi:hypothetical protein DID75_05935 [Candidatus Marinamargulisbacteria bacterium SCGC AG-410-N11]|nr:hypothetical protein DID75_05935 [Candidatus Marinamargulisbacteria bacterium SCGC AG-410-N11]
MNPSITKQLSTIQLKPLLKDKVNTLTSIKKNQQKINLNQIASEIKNIIIPYVLKESPGSEKIKQLAHLCYESSNLMIFLGRFKPHFLTDFSPYKLTIQAISTHVIRNTIINHHFKHIFFNTLSQKTGISPMLLKQKTSVILFGRLHGQSNFSTEQFPQIAGLNSDIDLKVITKTTCFHNEIHETLHLIKDYFTPLSCELELHPYVVQTSKDILKMIYSSSRIHQAEHYFWTSIINQYQVICGQKSLVANIFKKLSTKFKKNQLVYTWKQIFDYNSKESIRYLMTSSPKKKLLIHKKKAIRRSSSPILKKISSISHIDKQLSITEKYNTQNYLEKPHINADNWSKFSIKLTLLRPYDFLYLIRHKLNDPLLMKQLFTLQTIGIELSNLCVLYLKQIEPEKSLEAIESESQSLTPLFSQYLGVTFYDECYDLFNYSEFALNLDPAKCATVRRLFTSQLYSKSFGLYLTMLIKISNDCTQALLKYVTKNSLVSPLDPTATKRYKPARVRRLSFSQLELLRLQAQFSSNKSP